MRPHRLLVVLGTGTAVGKTHSAVTMIAAARAGGLRVAARKPAQSYDDGAPGAPPATDAELLAAATGESPDDVCPAHRWYARAMAPPMAADAMGLAVPTVDELVAELRWPDAAVDLGVVEGAGGVASPLAIDADNADLARRLAPDLVVLVADAGLGTINAVRLAVRALDGLVVRVLLNRYDGGDLQARNLAWLRTHGHLDVVVAAADVLG